MSRRFWEDLHRRRCARIARFIVVIVVFIFVLFLLVLVLFLLVLVLFLLVLVLALFVLSVLLLIPLCIVFSLVSSETRDDDLIRRRR